MELPCRKWTHISVGTKTKEQAIDEMYASYDAHPGRRRKPSREAFEVYRAVRLLAHGGYGVWMLYVRVRPRVSA